MTSSNLLSSLVNPPFGYMRHPALVSSPQPNVSFNWTLGPVLLGIFINTFFFGVTSYQFFSYYNTRFSDPIWIRAAVLSLLIIDVFHSCEMLYVPWYFFVENFTRPEKLGAPIWEFVITPALDSLAAGITQSFLAYRIFQLGKDYRICGLIALLTLTSSGLGVSVGVVALSLTSIGNASSIKYVTIPWLATQALTDILISVTLVVILLRSRTGNRRTDWALRTLLRKSIQTGIPAAVLAITILITYVVCGTETNTMFAALTFPHGRIYTLTLMDTLLVRTSLRSEIRRTDTLVLRNFHDEIGSSHAESDSQNLDVELRLVHVSTPTAYKDRSGFYSVEAK